MLMCKWPGNGTSRTSTVRIANTSVIGEVLDVAGGGQILLIRRITHPVCSRVTAHL